jgi:hypothetical protein
MDRKPEDDFNSPQYSAVVSQALDKGLTKVEAAELERKNVYGHDYRTDRQGRPIQQGIGSESNPSGNHFAALRKAEQQGLEPPGTYKRMVAELFKKDRETALRLGLREPARATSA